MKKLLAYATWVNQRSMARRDSADPDFEGCEEVLAYVYINEVGRGPVKVTDLVRALTFGTAPTVHRKVRILLQRGLVKARSSNTDRRIKHLFLSKTGVRILLSLIHI